MAGVDLQLVGAIREAMKEEDEKMLPEAGHDALGKWFFEVRRVEHQQPMLLFFGDDASSGGFGADGAFGGVGSKQSYQRRIYGPSTQAQAAQKVLKPKGERPPPHVNARPLANLVRHFTGVNLIHGCELTKLQYNWWRLVWFQQEMEMYNATRNDVKPMEASGLVAAAAKRAAAAAAAAAGKGAAKRKSSRSSARSSGSGKGKDAANGKNSDDLIIAYRQRVFLELVSILNAKNDPAKGVTIEGLDKLIEWMRVELRVKFEELDALVTARSTSFEGMGHVFKPNTMVVGTATGMGGSAIGFHVKYTYFTEAFHPQFGKYIVFHLCLRFIVGLGQQFGVVDFEHHVYNFSGVKPLSQLDHHVMDDKMKKLLDRRGRLYEVLAMGNHFKEYASETFFAQPDNRYDPRTGQLVGETMMHAKGRVMLDNAHAYKNAHYACYTGQWPKMTDQAYSRACVLNSEAQLQAAGGSMGNPTMTQNQSATAAKLQLFPSIPRSWYVICWPAISGYSFTAKTWGYALVNGISDIVFQKDSFEKLVLPEERKTLIQALVLHSKDTFADVIANKGGGTVFLLHGPPGVGKTLTAEAIAEMMERPLYYLSVGELGTSPLEVETKLGRVLDLCTQWEALVLMDEADIFMEKRRKSEVVRNAMVSVLLRRIEYHEGVIFLTTNRVKEFDPAFQSRITVALKYGLLDKATRRKVWENLVTASGVDIVREGPTAVNFDKLSEYELNGRQIKNSIRLSQALSRHSKRQITQEDVIRTIDIGADFQRDFLGGDDAQEDGLKKMKKKAARNSGLPEA